MLRATSETAVAMRVRSVRENPSRAASSRAACRAATMSASALDRDADLVVARLAAFHQRLAEPRAEVALEQVARGVDLPLPAAVAAGQREQHRAAPLGGRFGLVEGQQVLDPQPGAGPVQLRGDGAGGGAQLVGE